MIHKKLLSLLVLLMTAASGAWAEEVTVTFTQADLNGISTVAKDGVTLTPGNDYAHSGANLYDNGSNTFSVDKGTFTKIEIVNCAIGDISGWQKQQTGSYQPYPDDEPDRWDALYTLTWTGEAESVSFTANVFKIQSIVFTIEVTTIDVTTNAASEQDLFTTASFTMPASDVTVNYELVRDMQDEANPVAFSGLAERIIVKKKTGAETYEPLTPLTIQLIDQLAATDAQNIIADAGIKVKVLKGTDNNGTITYDETNPLTLEAFTADMQPGLYKMVAEPADATASPYTGTASLAFEAIAGFPVEIAAQEYVTYYSANDNLTLEENSGAKLYTITGIGETKATATEIPSANKEMPFLVYNPTEETKTFLLIPTDTEINQTYADEFKGTATATTIAASTDAQTNYAFNGKQFVWVRTALPVAANKAWLEVLTSTARSIALVFADDDATAISAVSGSPADKAAVYDLNGRKLDKKPTRKGVYIQNGRKVVVK